MSKSYIRVLPRDLFNESKLKKCFGRLFLKMHDRMLPEGMDMQIPESGEPFDIQQDEGSGDLFIANYPVTINGRVVEFYYRYNSIEDPYPFYCVVDGELVEVFDSNGEFTADFETAKF